MATSQKKEKSNSGKAAKKKNKSNKLLIFVLAAVIVLAIVLIFLNGRPSLNEPAKVVTQEQAVEVIKEKYPELHGYPYDGQPSKAIVGEKGDEGWYIAFIKNGSGEPSIGARCFIVKATGEIIENGNYSPSFGSEENANFSAKNCINNTPTQEPVSDAGDITTNKASVYCQEQGGTVEVRNDADGKRYGVCVMPGGKECNIWNFLMEKTCSPSAKASNKR